jgi:hypothetical protein
VHWIFLTQDSDKYRALLNTVVDLRVPLKEAYFYTSRESANCSRGTPLHIVTYGLYVYTRTHAYMKVPSVESIKTVESCNGNEKQDCS